MKLLIQINKKLDGITEQTLNSNMKLLILQNKKILHVCRQEFKFQYETINTKCLQMAWLCVFQFKFQCEPINTKDNNNASKSECDHLNSNVKLLIRYASWDIIEVYIKFKFQYESINTQKMADIMGNTTQFKFQCETINTEHKNYTFNSPDHLNSNVNLLIPGI